MADVYPEPHEWQPGDIIEWQQCPVLVIGRPGNDYDYPTHRTVAYLRVTDNIVVAVGKLLPGFKVEHKRRWTKRLRTSEEILFTKLMLGCHG